MEIAILVAVVVVALLFPLSRLGVLRWEMKNNRRWRLLREEQARADADRFATLSEDDVRAGAR